MTANKEGEMIFLNNGILFKNLKAMIQLSWVGDYTDWHSMYWWKDENKEDELSKS